MDPTTPRTNVIGVTLIIMITILCLGLIFLSSCTFSVTTVHTQGEASDVVDENQAPDVKPNIQIPAIS